MIYLFSFIVYLIVFITGLYFIILQSTKAQHIINRVWLVGFSVQLMINYLFWGNISAFGFLSRLISIERNPTNLIALAITSVICYGILYVVFVKANDYYHK